MRKINWAIPVNKHTPPMVVHLEIVPSGHNYVISAPLDIPCQRVGTPLIQLTASSPPVHVKMIT